MINIGEKVRVKTLSGGSYYGTVVGHSVRRRSAPPNGVYTAISYWVDNGWGIRRYHSEIDVGKRLEPTKLEYEAKHHSFSSRRLGIRQCRVFE